jgi:hypothetical protein
MGRPRPALDRGVPKPQKRRRLSEEEDGGSSNGLAIMAVQKQGAGAGRERAAAAAAPPALSCPATVTRVLGRAVEARQRTLCLLLSDAPDAGMCV